MNSSLIPTPPDDAVEGAVTEIYRTTPEAVLEIHILKPKDGGEGKPGIAFFFGGGWKHGTIRHFLPQAQHCATHGMVAFLVNYRINSRHGTSPLDAVEDARSAMRYLKSHAVRLGLDPARLAAGGGSAGGHLAFCTALASSINAPEDDLTVDPTPCLLIGYNPVCDTSEQGFGHDRFPAGTALRASPMHLVRAPLPPTLILHGTADKIIPIAQARAMQAALQQVGGRSELIEYEGRGHGFFNQAPDAETTLSELDRFLRQAGLLS